MYVFKRIPLHLIVSSLLTLVFVVLISVGATSRNTAQGWVEKGLEISRSKPNSNAEAQCYIRAIKADPNYAAAHFNLAYVLDAQAIENWRGSDTAWEDLDKVYAALAHYTAAARLDPEREAAYTNDVRIARLLFETRTQRPPALHLLRAQLSTCLEALNKTSDPKVQNHAKDIRLLILRLEKKIGDLKDCQPKTDLVKAPQIVKRLSRTFTRGQSPYRGPRVPLMIHFDLNKATIRPDSVRQLKEMARALKSSRLANKSILIEGHADSLGDEAYNQRLSEKRALSVKMYLVENFGFPRDRFQIIGYGETRPLVPNDTDAHRAMNRRVEFVNNNEMASFQDQIRNRKRSGSVDVFDVLY